VEPLALGELVWAPMVSRDQVVGALLVWGKVLSVGDLPAIQVLARQAASALDKAKLLAEQEKRARQLSVAGEIAAQASGAHDSEQLLRQVVTQIGSRFGCQVVAVLMPGRTGEELTAVAAYGLAEQDGLASRRSPSNGAGRAYATGETYVVNDLAADDHKLSRAGADSGGAELAVPLTRNGKVIGVLDMQSAQRHAFDASDVAAVELLAEQISGALARLEALNHERKRAAQLALVGQIASRATALAEPDDMLQAMVELVRERFGFHHVCVALFDRAGDELELRAVAGPNAGCYSIGERWKAAHGLIALAAHRRQTVMSGNVTSDSRHSPDADQGGANSELCVPLVSSGQVLGVLDVESVECNAFDASQMAAMETLADQMAVALEKALLLQAERRRVAQLALVNQVASQTTQLLPVKPLVHEAVESIWRQFGYFNVAIFLRDLRTGALSLLANAGPLAETVDLDTLDLSHGLIHHVAATGVTYQSRDTQDDPLYLSPFESREQDPVRSELAIPLRSGGNVLGVLDVQSRSPGAFDREDTSALEALADQLATMLENARLYESETRRAAELDAVRVLSLRLTAERDTNALLSAVMASAVELLDADGGALYIADDARGDLVVRVSYRLRRDYVGSRLRVGEGLAGRVAATGEPMFVENYALWEGRSREFDSEAFGRLMGVPLKWQSRLLGVLDLIRNPDRQAFGTDELRLANLFAAQAAAALENARLLDALQGRLAAQQILSDTSRAFLETTDSRAIVGQAASAARRALAADSAIVFLPDGDGDLVAEAFDGVAAAPVGRLSIPANASSIPGRAFTRRQALHWNDGDPGTSEAVHPLARQLGFYAGATVPMLIGERAVGVITVNMLAERSFDTTDLQALSLLANQTAIALERASYFERQQRSTRELNLLFESYRAATATLEPHQVIARLLEQLVRSMNVTSAFFVRIDRDKGEMTQTHAFFSEDATALERADTGCSWPTTELPELQRIYARRSFVMHADDAQLTPDMSAFMRENAVHTILRVPLVAADELTGYVALWETRARRDWQRGEIRFIETMASQGAAAFANAALYAAAGARTRELQALYEASQLLNRSLDIDEICRTSVNSLRDILGYHHVSVYFLREDRLRLQVSLGYEQVLDELALDRGVMARAFNTGQVIHLPDVTRDPDFLAAIPDIRSEIAVPLKLGDEVLGVLNVETVRGEERRPGGDELTGADVQLLATFGNQLTIAIQNARLFQQARQRVNELRTLHAASQALNTELELDAVLRRVAEQFIQALQVDSCTLNEWRPGAREATVLVDHDPDPLARVAPGERFEVDELLSSLVQEHSSLALRGDDPALSAAAHDYLAEYRWKSALVLPLVGKGQVLGFVELGDRTRWRAFGSDEVRLAESLANQAAIAIENAQLYRAARRRLRESETLYEFARQLSGTLDIRELGKRALEAAAQLAPFDIGEVCLYDERSGTLKTIVLTGEAVTEPWSDTIRDEGILGWVAHQGQTVRQGDVANDPRYVPLSRHVHSEICLPLRAGERVVGVLNLESQQRDAFDEHAEQLLTAFANQLAIAIENARLYEQTKRDAEVKAALLRELSHRVKNNLAAITSLLYLALDEPVESREEILNETLGRVQSMALAHALLARSEQAQVNLVELGRQVLQDTIRHLALPGEQVDVSVDGDTVPVAARQTTTLALVLNELATNCLRHGFGGAFKARKTSGERPALRLSIQSGPDLCLRLADNGSGLPPGFDLYTDAGLGLNLVRTLVEKDLHGQVSLRREDEWTCAVIRFKLEE
jgi:GAF domain-containing protein